jgi:DNA-binding CsgD family transcriptional regulator
VRRATSAARSRDDAGSERDDSPATAQLSPREQSCLGWTARGKSSWEIGRILSISENTVIYHIKNAMRKLGTASRTVAAVRAVELGLVEPIRDLPSRTESRGIHHSAPNAAAREQRDPPPSRSPASRSRRPSHQRIRIGVLPFLSTHSSCGDAWALSLSEEIAAALARFSWFDVIVPASPKKVPADLILGDDTVCRKSSTTSFMARSRGSASIWTSEFGCLISPMTCARCGAIASDFRPIPILNLTSCSPRALSGRSTRSSSISRAIRDGHGAVARTGCCYWPSG